jgi:glucoamylase
MPLAWAHAEYIKLCTSIQDQRVFDMPEQTVERYINKKSPSPFRIWRFDNQVNEIPSNRILRIEVLADAIIHWTNDDWNTIEVTETKDTCTGIFLADIPVIQASGNQITFTFYWKEPQSWEKRNFEVNIQKVEETVAEEKFTMNQP